ncbi:hypothetical protein ABRQ22_06340 [Cellulosimicrobium sp. ES-005]|uniref:Integral membrane protein n=1 Tax=Cellulosimicrobium sp. ES-005 TaxID=3163031 RepID=A0AAU8G365_9MICO
MSDSTAGGPPRDENEPQLPSDAPAPENPYAAAEPPVPPQGPVAQEPPAPQAPPVPQTPHAPAQPASPPPASPSGAPPAGAYPSPAGPPPGQPYGAPPAGAYPPPAGPPPGQPYGQQPPGQPPYGGQPGYPPPAAPYGQPGYPGQPIQVQDAFSYGWSKFTQNAGVILGGVLTYVVVLAGLSVAFWALLVGTATTTIDPQTGEISTAGGFAFGFGTFLFVAILVVLGFLVQAAVVNVSLLVTRGKKLEYADFFRYPNLGTVILVALLIGLATGVLAITIVGPLVFVFFAQFTLFYVIDKKLGVFDAFKASFTVVSKNLGTVVLLFLGVYLAELVGTLLCYVGLLVALPVAQIATAYVYRRLNGEQPV